MQPMPALASGLAGALTVTVTHELVRRVYPHAPRVDLVGMRAVARTWRATGHEPPTRDDRYAIALAGDLVSNAAWYALVELGDPRGRWARGALLGLVGGLGAAYLPAPLGLGDAPVGRTNATRALTVAWYVLGGLAAAVVGEWMGDRA